MKTVFHHQRTLCEKIFKCQLSCLFLRQIDTLNFLLYFQQKIRQFVKLGIGGAAGFSLIAFYRGEPQFYSNVVMPISQKCFDAETAHHATILAAKYGLLFAPRISSSIDKDILSTKVLGLSFSNPIGLAAGLDKDAEAAEGLATQIGFGFIEVGSVTPKAQPGNPKPRVFRLVEDQGVINRYGFNSKGHAHAKLQLQQLSSQRNFVLGVNLGKNKTTKDAATDYVEGVKTLGPFADYLVVNVSSPNTPGLRNLQGKQELENLISQVLKARDALSGLCEDKRRVPVLLKIAPDLSSQDKIDIADVIMQNPQCKIDGLIVSNTTISRPASLQDQNKGQVGGLSGQPLKDLATETIGDMFRLTNGSIAIVGVGGVSNGKDAYEKIRAGASLVQLYSAFVYQGPPVVFSVATQLAELLRKDGFSSVSEAVGADHRV